MKLGLSVTTIKHIELLKRAPFVFPFIEKVIVSEDCKTCFTFFLSLSLSLSVSSLVDQTQSFISSRTISRFPDRPITECHC